MNRKILSVLLMLMLVLSCLASCAMVGNGGNNNGSSDSDGKTDDDDSKTDDDDGKTDDDDGKTDDDDGKTDDDDGKTDEDDGKTDDEDGKTDDDDGNNGDDDEPVDLIYNKTSELYFITGPSADSAIAANIAFAIDGVREEIINYDSPESGSHKHEIVFGNTTREISKTAMMLLDRIQKNNNDELAYLIYSSGSSVAIVYDEDEEGIIEKLAAEYFINNYVSDSLLAGKGEMYSEVIDLVEDYYVPLDEEYISAKWAEFEKEAGKEITDALKQLYAIYSSDMVLWAANLYEPNICVCKGLYGEETCSGTKYCGTAGFYFSNSARNTLGFLPDVESTNQLLNFLASSGLCYNYDNSYANILPEDMKKAIGDFVVALQEPNGYFYHPQWGIEFTDTKISRRARDLNWSVSILTNFGRKPIYNTPSGVEGGGDVASAAPIKELTGRLGGGSSVSLVSAVIAVADDAYAPQLQSLDAFKAYIASLDIRNQSYVVGNELTSQNSQIINRDKEIGTEDDPTPLMDYLIGWLNENQNPETGHWDFKKPGEEGYDAYYGVNGLLKISGIYNSAKRVIPHAREAANSAIAAIIDPTPIDAVVDLYNTWFAISNILTNLRQYGDSEDAAEADDIVIGLREMAPSAIIVSRDKISVFFKPDGSASYARDHSSSHSQGCPVAIPNTNEGDVNGNVIASTGLVTNLLKALELDKFRVPIFGDVDRMRFLETIENLSPVNKVEDVIVPDPVDFDYESVGYPSDEVKTALSSGTATVIADPTGSDKGNVLEILSHDGGGDYIRLENNTSSTFATTSVFEGDFYIADANDVEYAVQLYMDSVYMIIFRIKEDGIHIHEVSASTSAKAIEEDLGIVAQMGEWFRLKVEYYAGTHDTVRIKVYADTDFSDGVNPKLYSVTDNYFDANGNKFLKPSGNPSKTYKQAEIYVMNKSELIMYADNLNCYQTKVAYTEHSDPNDQPFFNIDAPDKDRVIYDFDDGAVHEDIILSGTETAIGVSDGVLAIGGVSKNTSVRLPVTVRTKGSRCGYVSLDAYVSDASVGSSVLLEGMDADYKIYGLELIVCEDEDGKYIGARSVGKQVGGMIENLRLPIGESFNIELEYYHAEDILLIYANGEFVTAETNIYSDGNRRTMDSFTVNLTGGSFELTLDNLIVEKINKSFMDAVAPDKESKIYTFDTVDPEVLLGGSGTKYLSGGIVEMNSASAKGSLSIPVNNRATIYTVAVFDAKIKFSSAKTGVTHLINFSDTNNNVMLALALVKSGSKILLCEVAKDGVLENAIYSFAATDTVDFSLEIYPDQRMVHVKRNGSIVAKTSIFVGEEYTDNRFGSVTVESADASSVITLDELKFETLYAIYSGVKLPEQENLDNDLSKPMTFEHSNSGNIPSSVGYGLAGTTSAVRVERVPLNDGSYSNVLAYYTSPGSNDFLNYTATESLDSFTAVAFEADMMLDLTSGASCYQIYFSSKDSKNRVYMIQFVKNGDTYKITDNSNVNNSDGIAHSLTDYVINNGEWFKLRIEYYRGAADTVRFKVYLNGECVGISDNFYGSEKPDATLYSKVECCYFYSLGAVDGTLYYDNVTFFGFMGSCDEDVNVN